MNAGTYNAPGIGGPPDSDERFLELVAEYMQAGMSQDDAEIAATERLDEIDEIAALDAGEDAFERQREDR